MIDAEEKARIPAEAAAWVARLDLLDDGETRDEFEAWAAHPAHRAAYERSLDQYRRSGLIRQSPISREVSLESAYGRPPSDWVRGAAAAGIAGLLLLGTYQLTSGPLFGPPLQTVLLSSGSTTRQVELEDGSSLTLAPSSELKVDLTRSERRAVLRRGRAKLSVAVEQRPFTLVAGGQQATVNRGDFELALDRPDGSIVPSDALSMSAPGSNLAVPASTTAPAQTFEFSATPLSDVAALANRDRQGPLLVIDPRISGRKVTGLFRAGDSAALARSLAVALDVQLVVPRDGTLRLEPRLK